MNNLRLYIPSLPESNHRSAVIGAGGGSGMMGFLVGVFLVFALRLVAPKGRSCPRWGGRAIIHQGVYGPSVVARYFGACAFAFVASLACSSLSFMRS